MRYALAADVGEEVGRFGPLIAHGGRTHGNPCTLDFGMCGDRDVEAWQMAANKYLTFARQLRKNVVLEVGPHVKEWPEKARFGEVAYRAAEKMWVGDVGYLDSAKVAAFVEIQRLAKTALEFWFQTLDLHWDVEDMQDLTQTPYVPPLPEFPDLLGGAGKVLWPVAAIALGVALVMRGGGR